MNRVEEGSASLNCDKVESLQNLKLLSKNQQM